MLSGLCNTLLIALVAANALLAGRLGLAERGLETALAHYGYAAKLDVAALTPTRLEIHGLHLSAEGPSLRHLRLDYTPRSLIEGRVAQVSAAGLRARIDLMQPEPLRPLLPLLAPAAAGGTARESSGLAAPARLPTMRLDDAEIMLVDQARTARIAMQGALRPLNGDLAATLRGAVTSPAGRLDLSLEATNLRAGGRFHLESTGAGTLAALPWPAALPGRLTGGTANLHASLEGRLPPLDSLANTNFTIFDSALPNDLQVSGTLGLTAQEVTWRPYARNARLDAALSLDVQDGTAVVRLPEPLDLIPGAVEPGLARALGLDAASTGADLLRRAERLTLAPWSEAGEVLELRRRDGHGRLTARASLRAALAEGAAAIQLAGSGILRPGARASTLNAHTLNATVTNLPLAGQRIGRLEFQGRGAWEDGALTLPGDLDVTLADLDLHGADLGGLSLSGPVEIVQDARGLRARLTAPGRLHMPHVPHPAALGLALPLNASLPRGSIQRTAAGLVARATLDPGRLDAKIATGGGNAMAAALTPGPIQVICALTEAGVSAELTAADASLALPDRRIEATGLDAALRLGARPGALAELRIARLQDTSAAPRFAPMTGRFVLRRNAATLTLGGTVEPVAAPVSLPVTGRYDLNGGQGRLQIGPGSLPFAPEGLQPAALSPRLSALTEVSGRLDLEAWGAWDDGTLSSGGRLALAETNARFADARVEGLRGAVVFDSLWPPRTRPDQRITADRIVAGLPLEAPRLRFAVDSDAAGAPVLRIALAEVGFAEGRLFVTDAVLRPLAPDNTLTLRASGLSLARLVALLELEDVSATGRLEGRLPLRLRDGVVTIDDGTLTASESGVLKIRLGDSADNLAQRGESVRMMLRALEDFRYDTLAMTIARPGPNDLGLKVTLQGHNPDVLEGYPFRFNVDLSGDLEPVIAALREGRRLSSELLQRALGGASAEP